jgi:sugar phosphate isomerase/epimerase
MKKTVLLAAAVFGLALVLGTFALADSRQDLQAIKKAVKDNPNFEPGKEVKWFKVLVTDTKTNKDKVKITLPLVLVEAFVKCADNKHLRIDDGDCDIDFEALLAELKKVGPMALIEVYEDDETVKVWLE